MAILFDTGIFSVEGLSGEILAGAKLYWYASGTSTPQATYSDEALSTPNANPVVSNADGRFPPIWLQPLDYKYVLKSFDDTILVTRDPIVGTNIPDNGSITADSLTNDADQLKAISAKLLVGSSLSFVPDLSLQDKANQVRLNVLDCIPVALWPDIWDGTNTTDLTDYFNLATGADESYGSGILDNRVMRIIEVPAGYYKVGADEKTIYLRKGQHLRGAGVGATFFDLSGTTDNTTPIFVFGTDSDGNVDPGGLAPEMSSFFTYGGPATAAVIDPTACQGYMIHTFFMTSPGLGIKHAGGDGKVFDAIIDQGLTGIALGGQNNDISNVRFFNMNYDINVSSDCFDCSIDIESEYNQYSSIAIPSTSSNIQNLMIRRHSAIYNEQYGTAEGSLRIDASNADIKCGELVYRNTKGAAVVNGGGTDLTISIDSLHVNGLKTNPVYTQSTTSGGIYLTTADMTIGRVDISNCAGQPIDVQGSSTPVLRVLAGAFAENAGGGSDVNISDAGGGEVHLSNIVGSGRLLFNAQSSRTVVARNLSNWLPPVTDNGTYKYTIVPFGFSNIIQASLKANVNVGGSANYRKSISILVEKDNDYNLSAKSFLKAVTLIAGDANDGGAIALSAAFSTPGGGTSVSSVNSGYMALYWPNTYASETLDVQVLV